jgi:biopolymer transport protein ExbD
MKKKSRRARRLERHNSRKAPGLNLVSLMDIFTILVFFLLVNSSSDQQLPSSQALTLPTSVSESQPQETLRIIVTARDVLVEGRPVVRVDALRDSEAEFSTELKEELNYRRSLSRQADTVASNTLTVLADQNISYDIIQKIVRTGQQANYTKIAFAADQVTDDSSD